MTTDADMLALRHFLTIGDHTPGRLRVRVGLGAAGADGAALRTMRERFERGRGIRSFKFNPFLMSMAIEYDPAVIPPETWTAFVGGSDQEAMAAWTTMTAT